MPHSSLDISSSSSSSNPPPSPSPSPSPPTDHPPSPPPVYEPSIPTPDSSASISPCLSIDPDAPAIPAIPDPATREMLTSHLRALQLETAELKSSADDLRVAVDWVISQLETLRGTSRQREGARGNSSRDGGQIDGEEGEERDQGEREEDDDIERSSHAWLAALGPLPEAIAVGLEELMGRMEGLEGRGRRVVEEVEDGGWGWGEER